MANAADGVDRSSFAEASSLMAARRDRARTASAEKGRERINRDFRWGSFFVFMLPNTHEPEKGFLPLVFVNLLLSCS
jgi:hypothetical protein